MTQSRRYNMSLAALLMAALLAACGGGGDAPEAAGASADQLAREANAPALTNDIARDGVNWINFRRAQSGLPALARNGLIEAAAQGHADYLRINDNPRLSHEQIVGKPGFTGVDPLARLNNAGYHFAPTASFIYGEVIAAADKRSGFYLAEQLMAAVYHRYVMFEPLFKEIGGGAASNSAGYTYFTADFTANNGYGPGLGRGRIVTYPFANQTLVPVNFFSDQEVPDPVPDRNEVGYPISVHGDLTGNLRVQSFSLRERGGATLPVRLLVTDSDPETPLSAAAIIPLESLRANTVYDVSFSGTVDGVGTLRNWSFTTR